MNLPGLNGARFTELRPSTTSSLTIFPLTGAQSIPQQLCPQHMYAPSVPGTPPRMGNASGGHGRMHDCVFFGPPAPTLALSPANDARRGDSRGVRRDALRAI